MRNVRSGYKKYRKKLLKLTVVITVLIFALVALSSYINSKINPVIKNMSEAEVRALAISGINNAVNIVINEGLNYDEFVKIERNSEDEITLIQLNFVKINRLARDIANLSESNISSIGMQTIDIPLGAFTGSTVFAAVGPPVTVGLMPIGSVLCNYISHFDSVGINQTRHRLYIAIETTICIVLPLEELPLEITVPVLVVENIIIGKVPDTYIQASTQLDALDLLP
jgi:sporulation protein YunB